MLSARHDRHPTVTGPDRALASASSPLHPEIDLDSIARAVDRRFPELRPARPLEALGCGCRSVAVATPAGIVVRVGLIADAADDYAREWQIAPFLSQELRSIVPSPRWYAPPCEDFPHGAIAYPTLHGRTPKWSEDPGAAFTRDLGAFMAHLHALDVDAATAAGIWRVDAYARMLGARPVVVPVLRGRLSAGELARVDAWWDAFASDDRMRTARVAVCHHDLWHDNLLRSPEGRLSGVLDIAHVEIADPAHDFAAPRYFGDRTMSELIAAYRDGGGHFDGGDEHRAQRYFEAREFGGLAWVIEHDDNAEIDGAIEKIKRGPLLMRV